MDTKEAIGIIYEYIDIAKNNANLSIGFTQKDIDEFREIISLLERGEKFEQIWEELKSIYFITVIGEGMNVKFITMQHKMKEFEQKYLRRR